MAIWLASASLGKDAGPRRGRGREPRTIKLAVEDDAARHGRSLVADLGHQGSAFRDHVVDVLAEVVRS